MDISINNSKDAITYYNKNTVSIYNEDDIIRFNVNLKNEDIVSLIAKIISIDKNLNKTEVNALEIILATKDIKGRVFKDYYCQKYKVSESTAARSLAGLVAKYIIYITKEDIIKVNSKYLVKDKDVNKSKVFILEVADNNSNINI